ncbi:hypothetical protein HAX54_014224, partial [Datura stramonium]|nr:hypothetical protein [Datura stramonium]
AGNGSSPALIRRPLVGHKLLSTSPLAPVVCRCSFVVPRSPTFFHTVGNYDQFGVLSVSF